MKSITHFRKIGWASLVAILVACQTGGVGSLLPSGFARQADDPVVVDCLLPGQVRKLGGQMTYLTPRRPIKTSAVDCEIRGGEYVAFDRAMAGTRGDQGRRVHLTEDEMRVHDSKGNLIVAVPRAQAKGNFPDYKTVIPAAGSQKFTLRINPSQLGKLQAVLGIPSSDDVTLHSRGHLSQSQRVPDEVGEVLDLGLLVVVGEEHGVALLLQ